MEENELVITQVEVSTLFGVPALLLHYVGDKTQFPAEIVDAARDLVKRIHPDKSELELEPHEVPSGSQVVLQSPEESGDILAISFEDALKYGVNIANGEIELDY